MIYRCPVCGATTYDRADAAIHRCTYETPTREEPMHDDDDFEPYQGNGVTLSHNDDIARNVRLTCLRLATETGMNVDAIQPTADQWTDWVLGTTTKEN